MTIKVSRFHRATFSREREFVIIRSIVLDGQILSSGRIDKTQFTTRRLRQLWDQRYIAMAPVHDGVKVTSASARSGTLPSFDQMSATMLRTWLKEKGVNVRATLAREKLISRAKEVQEASPVSA